MQTLTTQLTAHQRVQQIMQALLTLPPEKISEVWDFVAFLQKRYAGTPSLDVRHLDGPRHDRLIHSQSCVRPAIWMDSVHTMTM